MKWSKEGFDYLEAQGIELGLCPGRDGLARFVFGHSTSDEEIESLLTALTGANR